MIPLEKKKYRRPLRLFLIEMIIALLFFSISGAVIINVFAAANRKVKDSELNNNIAICAQSCAEVYSVYGDCQKMAEVVFGEGQYEGGEFNITLNDKCERDDYGAITLSIIELKDYYGCGTLGTVSLVFSRSGAELYSLRCRSYIPYPYAEGGSNSDAEQ